MTEGNNRNGTPQKPGDDRIQDSCDSYLGILDNFPNPIWRAGTDAKCNYFNREWLVFTGRTFEQELGDGWVEGVHPEDLDRCVTIYRDAFNRREPFEMEYRLRYHDGTYRWLLDCGKPYYDAGGTFIGYLGVCYDIHDQKQAQEAILATVRLNQKIDTLSVDECMTFTLDEAERLTASRIGFFHFVNEDEKTIQLVVWSTETRKHCFIPKGSERNYPVEKGGVWLDALRERKPVIHNDYASLPHRRGLPAGHVPVTRELVVPIFDAGKIVAIIGVGNKAGNYGERDIDILSLLAKNAWTLIRRKRIEESLQDSEKRYRDMFEINNAVMFIVDPESCRIVDANAAACRYYGYSREEMKELLITQINAQDPEISKQNLADAAGSPGAVFRFRHKKKSGEIRDIEVFSSRIILGGRLLLHSIIQDITERVRAEEALRESREQYRELVENLSEAVISLDREGKFTYVSPAVERLYGFLPKDLIGKHFQKFLHPDDMHSFTDVFGKELAGTYPTDEFRILAQDGSVRFISVSPRPIERGGSVVGFNYVINDFTGRKKADEEERLTRERFETLVKIAEMRDTGENRLSTYVLQAACRMTGSLFAFIGTVVPDESMMDIITWSPEVMGECRVSSAPLHFPVKTAGIWADAIREHRPKIVNDYAGACPPKKGLPDGHVRISRFLSVPILENGRVVMVAAVANKPAPYDDEDVTRLTLLMQGIWGNLQKRKADEALRESEEKFRLFFNNVNDAVYVHRMDPDGKPGRLIEVNNILCQRLGYTREELLSMSMGDLISDEGKRRMLRVSGEVEQSGQATFETEHLCKDGTILPVEVSTHCFMQGQIQLALANARDITERKKAEAILKKGETLLNEMGRLAHIGGWELDVQTQNLLLTHETYRISETPEDEPFNFPRALGYFDQPGRASLEAAVKRCTESGEPFDLELPVTTAMGRHIWTRAIGNAIREDEKIVKLTGTLQDVTERKKAEMALLESRQLLEAVLNSITVRVFWKDRNLLFLGCNTAFARDAGYEKPEDIIGKDDYAMAWREQAATYQADDRNVIGNGTEKLLFEEPQTTPTGETICLLTSKVPLKNAGGDVIGVLGTYLDITERKKAEEVLEDFNRELEEQVRTQTEKINTSLNEKIVLLREIHHRVKNNLQLIISLTNLQMRQSDNEQLIQIMKETQNRVRAMSLVHEKLYQSEDIARISFAEYTRFLATQLFAFYAVNSRQVKLEFDIGKIMLDINTAIPTGLILNELVSNALKHAFPDNRAGTIFIAARDEGDTLSLSVRDTGIGIPPDFDWNESQTLGLRLVRILTEQLNGTIELLPVEKGTAFFIRLTKAKGSESAGT